LVQGENFPNQEAAIPFSSDPDPSSGEIIWNSSQNFPGKGQHLGLKHNVPRQMITHSRLSHKPRTHNARVFSCCAIQALQAYSRI